jgi:hypothetical protein
VASSHKFISLHFYIKYLNMSNNIPVTTQEEFEPNLLPNPKLTMDLPYFAPLLLVPQFAEQKFLLRMALYPMPYALCPMLPYAALCPMGKSCYTCPEPDFI